MTVDPTIGALIGVIITALVSWLINRGAQRIRRAELRAEEAERTTAARAAKKQQDHAMADLKAEVETELWANIQGEIQRLQARVTVLEDRLEHARLALESERQARLEAQAEVRACQKLISDQQQQLRDKNTQIDLLQNELAKLLGLDDDDPH